MNIAIAGGGIVGLAIAYKLSLKKNVNVDVFEKEKEVGFHQSGRNSGVLHCGLAYKPESLKAKLAVSGIRQMIDFCKKNNIDHDICGKIVVATDENEAILLDNSAKRGKSNGLSGLKMLNNRELKEREPFVKSHKTLLVPEEGIVDYMGVMLSMKEKIINSGGNVFLNTKIKNVKEIKDKVYINNNSSKAYNTTVSNTHLTLPTICSV